MFALYISGDLHGVVHIVGLDVRLSHILSLVHWVLRNDLDPAQPQPVSQLTLSSATFSSIIMH